MNAAHNSTQRLLFLKDYAEVIPIIIGLRNDGYSLPEIAKELNSRGFMTRENKPFSHVQVLRILQRAHDANSTQTSGQDSTQNELIESQVQSEVAQLKCEIYALKQECVELQIEMSEMKSQLSELIKENQQLQTDFVKLISEQSCSVQSVQGVQDNRIESVPRQSTEPARQIIDGEIKKAILQQANQLHAENSELSKSHIAKMLSEKFNVRVETARDWLKKLW
jgi:DNA-binding transcriptional MerR regulator